MAFCLPVVSLTDEDGFGWTVVADLLSVPFPSITRFEAEIDNDGGALLRFGTRLHGMAPVSDTVFQASYRIGNGTAGNIGADALALVAAPSAPYSCRTPYEPGDRVNHKSASGKRRHQDPQRRSLRSANWRRSHSVQERAVTPQDYGTHGAQEVDPSLSQALGTFRWTGSWRTVFISADPEGTETWPLRRKRLRYRPAWNSAAWRATITAVMAPIYNPA